MFYHGNTINSDLIHTDLPPQAGFPLGTDDQGFDELGLLMKGGQAALEVGFAAAFIGIVIGMLWGAIAGLAGGIVDSAMMRVVDVFLSIPFLFIVLIVAVRYGASVLGLSRHHRRLHLAGPGPAGQGRGAHAADQGLRRRRPGPRAPAGGG